jgi:glycosyltransferase involved in cell wall biosynthesis
MSKTKTKRKYPFTIILCVKNEIGRIESFLRNIEKIDALPFLLVVDGASTDGTWEALQDYPLIQSLQANNVGLLGQRLIGIQNSNTDLVVLVNVDDMFTKADLFGAVSELSANPNIDGLQFSLIPEQLNFWGVAWGDYFRLTNPTGNSVKLLGRPCVARKANFTFDYPKSRIFNEDTWVFLQERDLDRKYLVTNHSCIRSCPGTLRENLLQFWRYGVSDSGIADNFKEHMKLFFHSIFRIMFLRGVGFALRGRHSSALFCLLLGLVRSFAHFFSLLLRFIPWRT